ncbi:hypothetical protein [Streptomyces olivochromogenes]|uniref:Uncharacterized protein n=1 Tax=Streptomyces olivochromogenes TaxID=1963 RepID=A0A250VFB3_STROL|nr:hypothetical protein [Streptomyces olivochromogenes]KUN47443.1 hypothetical protein AQJ27_10935 [Streptomyces olivochromogenes]GAX52861.1 hypothetical protein SO3561_04380 [Streptomyces olivochromogenes]
MTTPATYRDRLAGHLAQVESWILGAEFDVQEFERQITEAGQHLANATRQFEAATANVHTLLSDGPDSVTFRSDVDRQVATLLATIQLRTTKTNLRTCQQALETLKAKQANAGATLPQAQALKRRIELAMQADELPSIADELEALLED